MVEKLRGTDMAQILFLSLKIVSCLKTEGEVSKNLVLLLLVTLTDRASAPPTHLKLCSPCQMLRLKQVSGDEENSRKMSAGLHCLHIDDNSVWNWQNVAD
jgi:hypothetical protein